jgi:uncharacterized membrane protein
MNLSVIKKIFGRGFTLAIPLGVVLYVFIKLVEIFEKLISPLATKLGIERILGELTLTIITVFLLLVFMFLLGLLMQLSIVSSFGKSLEDVVVKFVPSLNQIKTMAAEKLDVENTSNTWKPVLLLHEKKYFPAFVIEELNDLITLYTIIGTSINDGEILITRKSDVSIVEITASQIRLFSKQYGKGYLSLIEKGIF